MKLLNILLLFFFCLGCHQKQVKDIGNGNLGLDTAANTYAVYGEDLTMNSAIDKAKKTITEFDKALKSNNSSCTDFAVKKRYKTADGGEHMWVAGISIMNANYHGFINNDAEQTTEVKYGDTVIVRKEEITDWMYLENHVLRGGFTIREIRNKLNKEERMKMDKDLGFKIED